MAIKAKFNGQFWDTYKEYKKSNPDSVIVTEVRHFFKRKSASEKQAINYPCQAESICGLNKFRKFGESCDGNTEPSFVVI